MDRAAMIKTITSHGWNAELLFSKHGPVLFIRGSFRGFIPVPVPARLEDDHSEALADAYMMIGAVQARFGMMGRA